MGLARITTSASPVTLEQMRAHLRLGSDTSEDELVQAYLDAATDFIERETNQTLGTTMFRYTLDAFPDDDADTIRLPNPPLIDVAEVSYVDRDGISRTLDTDDYTIDTGSMPGRIHLTGTRQWPATSDRPGCVEITFMAGYSTGDLPPTLSAAVRLLAAQLFEQREAAHDRTITEVPFALRAIINQHRFVGCP